MSEGSPHTWGGITIAGMPLALDMTALREVLPAPLLSPLPSASPLVAGGLNMRGVTVPVLNLAAWLGQPAPAEAAALEGGCVVVVTQGSRLIGLRADGVNGVFEALPGSVRPLQAQAPVAFAGSLRRADNGALVNLLALQALATLPDIPWIPDPEPHRQPSPVDAGGQGGAAQQLAGPSPLDEAGAATLSLMVVGCGGQALALDAMTVHATLWAPTLQASAMTGGACLGVLPFGTLLIPALDLPALCGLAPLSAAERHQALVIRSAQGLAALLVDKVEDIVRLPAEAVVALPAFALPLSPLFRGVLPASAWSHLAAHMPGAPARALGDVLVLDSAALLADPLLRELSGLNVSEPAVRAGAPADAGPAGGASSSPPGGPAAAAPGRPMITFHLGQETAVPLAQVREILPARHSAPMFGPDNVLRRIEVLRGQSIPVMCLARLMGLAPEGEAGPNAAVLVVDSGGECMGFAVPALRAIEQACWECQRPDASAALADEGAEGPVAQALRSRQMATLGQGEQARTLRVLDLQRLVLALVQPAGSAAARSA